VNAALRDSFEDVSKSKEAFYHWGARGLKVLLQETFNIGVRRVLLPVNRNTMTAAMPLDFSSEVFVGVVDDGYRMPMVGNSRIASDYSMTEVACETKCEKCNQDTTICEEMETVIETEEILFGSIPATKTTVKTLHPDGSYYLEVTTPYWDTESQKIEYSTEKTFIEKFDMKECGCLETTPENIEKIQCCCPEIYGCYYTPCDPINTRNLGGYMIYPDAGIIQLERKFPLDKLYLEYKTFMTKSGGEYLVPAIAFETLVQWILVKNIDGRKNTPVYDKQWRVSQYEAARKSMNKARWKISLEVIIQASRSVPRFDIGWEKGDC
jgi:hypothetical protein